MITEKKTEPTTTTPEVNVQKTKDMENINIVCSKHGIINNGAFYIRYSTIQKDSFIRFDNALRIANVLGIDPYEICTAVPFSGEISEDELYPAEIRHRSK